MRRSLFIIAMTLCLLFAMSTGIFAADYTDVKDSDWFIKDLNEATDAGIAKGYEDNTFRPNEKVTRAEMVAMFNRALDIKYSRDIDYTDVKASEWYTEDIKKAQYAGIVMGYEDGTFKPGNPISRQEAGALMGRIITKGDYEGYNELQDFKDFDSIGSWAWDDLGLAYRKEYIKGYPDGTFGPGRNLTRAEAITIVMRILDGETVIKDDVTFTSNGDALREAIYTGKVLINSPTANGAFEITDCKIFAPVTFTSKYTYNKLDLYTSTICELFQKSSGLTINMLGKTTIKELTLADDTIVNSTGEGNLVEWATINDGNSASNSINSDTEILMNVTYSAPTEEMSIETPVNFIHNGQTIGVLNVNAVTDMILADGEITTLNMNSGAKDSNIDKNIGSYINTLNSHTVYFLDCVQEDAPAMHNVYKTTVYVSEMPAAANYAYMNPPTSKLVVQERLNAPTDLKFTGSQKAYSSTARDRVYLEWSAPELKENGKIVSYKIYKGNEEIGVVAANVTKFDVTEYVTDSNTYGFSVKALSANNYYADSEKSATESITRLQDAGFSLYKEDDATYLYVATDAAAVNVEAASVESGWISGDTGLFTDLGTFAVADGVAKIEIPAALIDADKTFRIAVETVGGGLTAGQLDKLTSIKIDTLSAPSYGGSWALEDKINYNVAWSYTVPDALFAEKYVFQLDDGEPQDVVNGAYDAFISLEDVLDGKYQVKPDQLKVNITVNLMNDYDSHTVSLTAIGNEKYTEADAKAAAAANTKDILFLTSVAGVDSTGNLTPAGSPSLVFDPAANDGAGDYVLSWPRNDSAESYEVTTNAVKNATVIVPQVAEGEVPETSLTAPNGINVNDDGALGITNRGSGAGTISSAVYNSKLYHAAGLINKEFNPYTGELSWTDPTDISKMPSGYMSTYLIRVTDESGNIYYHYTNDASVNIFDLSYEDGKKVIVDGIAYDIEVINIGSPQSNNTQQVYGEYFGEDDNIIIEDIQYSTVGLVVKAYTGNYEKVTPLASETTKTRLISGATVNVYANELPDPGAADEPLISDVTDGSGQIAFRLPYGSYRYEVEYSETVDGIETLISTFSDAPAPGDLAPIRTITVDAASVAVNAYIMRDPLVTLDRVQNLALVTDGPVSGWKFTFDPTPNANTDPASAYKVTYDVGGTPNTQVGLDDGDKIAIGLSGLFDEGTTAPTTGNVDIITSARPNNEYLNADWADSATAVTLVQLAQPVITGFDKVDADTYTVSWDPVADASYYRVTVDGNSTYSYDTSCTVTLESIQSAESTVSVVAIYDTDGDPENGIVKTAVYNEGSVRVLEQKDDDPDNPYWAATIYVDSLETTVTIDRYANVDATTFELTTDAENNSTLSWDKASELDKYDISIDGGEVFTVTGPAVAVDHECEVSVVTKGNYSPEAVGESVTKLYADSIATKAQVHQSKPMDITYTQNNEITWTDNAAFDNLDQNYYKDGYIEYTVTIYNTFDNNEVVFEETIQASSNDDCIVKVNNSIVTSDVYKIVVTSKTAKYSLILGSFGSQNTDFRKVAKELTLYDPIRKEFVEGETTDLIKISTADQTIYSLNKIDRNGRTVYLVEGGQYTVTTAHFVSDAGVEYKAGDPAATYVISETYPGRLLVYVYPVDYITLDKSEEGTLSADGNTLTLSEVTTADKGQTTEIGNITYTLYGVDGVNGAEEVVTTGTVNEGYVTYDLSQRTKDYSYYISRAHSDVINSVDSDTVVVVNKLAAPDGIRVERSAETGKITAYWNPVANAVGYDFNGTPVQETYAELIGNTISLIAKGNADGVTVVEADALGIFNFYLDSDAAVKDDIEVTAAVKVYAIDSVSKDALTGYLRVVNADTEEVVYDQAETAVPEGGMFVFLPDGNYRASFFPAEEYNGLYDPYHGIEFTITNGEFESEPAEVVFKLEPKVQQIEMNIGVFLNHAPLADAEVTITQTNDPQGKDFATFNNGDPYVYTTDGSYESITMPEGTYTAKVVAANGDVLAEAYPFTVTAEGTKTVDIQFFQNAIPIKVVDALTNEPFDDPVEVTFTGAVHNAVYTVENDYSKVQLYSDTYTISVEPQELDGVDYLRYTRNDVVVTETTPTEIVIALVPRDAVKLDTASEASIDYITNGVNAGKYEVAFNEITTYNGGNVFKDTYKSASIEFSVYGIDADGNENLLQDNVLADIHGNICYYAEPAVFDQYKAYGFLLKAEIVDPYNVVPNPIGSESMIKETKLAAPEFNDLFLDLDQQYKLTWTAVANAEHYNYEIDNREADMVSGSTTDTYLKPVNGGEVIRVAAVPANAYTLGQKLTSSDGIFNYYLPSDTIETTINVSATLTVLVQDGYTGKTVKAVVSVDPAVNGNNTVDVAAGGTLLTLPVGSEYTFTVKAADAELSDGVAYAEESLTEKVSVKQNNVPVVLSFEPADSEKLPKSELAAYSDNGDGTVDVVFKKIDAPANSVVSYSIVGVKANGLEETIAIAGEDLTSDVKFSGLEPYAYESYKLVASAVGDKNYVASETAFTFDKLPAPVLGDVFRGDNGDLMLGWDAVANATAYVITSDTDTTLPAGEITETAHKVIAGNGYSVKAVGNADENQSIANGGFAFYLDSDFAVKDASEVTDKTTITFTAADCYGNDLNDAITKLTITERTSGAEMYSGDLTFPGTVALEDGKYTAKLTTDISKGAVYEAALMPETLNFVTADCTINFTVAGGKLAFVNGNPVAADNIDFLLNYTAKMYKGTVYIVNNGVPQAGKLTLKYDTTVTTDIEIPETGKVMYFPAGKEYTFTYADNAFCETVVNVDANGEYNGSNVGDIYIDATTTAIKLNAIDGYTGKPVEAQVTAVDPADADLNALLPGTYKVEVTSDALTPGVAYKELIIDVTINKEVIYPLSVVFVPVEKIALSSSASVSYDQGQLIFAKVDNADSYTLKKYSAADGSCEEVTKKNPSFNVGDIGNYSYFELVAENVTDVGIYSPSVTVVTYDKLAAPQITAFFNADAELALGWGTVANATGYVVGGVADMLSPETTVYAPVENGKEYKVTAKGNLSTVVEASPGSNIIALYGNSETTSYTVDVTVPVTVKLIDGATGLGVNAYDAVTASDGNSDVTLPAALKWGETYDITVDVDNTQLKAELSAAAYKEAKVDDYQATFSNSEITIILEPKDSLSVSQSPAGKIEEADANNYQITFKAPDVDGGAIANDVAMEYTLYKVDAKGGLTSLGNSNVGAGSSSMDAVFTVAKADIGAAANLRLQAKAVKSGENYTVSFTDMSVNKLTAPKLNGVTKNTDGDLVLSWSAVAAGDFAPQYKVVKDSADSYTIDATSYVVEAGSTYTVTALGNLNTEVANSDGIRIYLDSDAASSGMIPDPALTITFKSNVAGTIKLADGQEKHIDANDSVGFADVGTGTYDPVFTPDATGITTTNGTTVTWVAPALKTIEVKNGVAAFVDSGADASVVDINVTETTPKYAEVVVNLFKNMTNDSTAQYTLTKDGDTAFGTKTLTSGTELLLEPGTYTATAVADTTVTETFTVDSNGKASVSVVNLNVIDRQVFVSFFDGENGSSPAGRVSIGGQEYDIPEGGTAITLAAGTYDVAIVTKPDLAGAEGDYQDPVLNQIDVTGSNTYLNYTIRYIPKDSQYVDGPTGVTVKQDGNTYSVDVTPVSETGVQYALYGIDSNGTVAGAIKGPQTGTTFSSLTADDLTKYAALKVVVTKDDTDTTKYVFGDAVFSVVKLATPSGFSVAVDAADSNKHVLNWAVVPGATKYTWSLETGGTGENRSPQIIGVEDGQKYTIKASGNLNTNGATSNGLVPVFYLDSDASADVEISISTSAVSINDRQVFVSFFDGENGSFPAGKVSIGGQEYDIPEGGTAITLAAGTYDVAVVTKPALAGAEGNYQDPVLNQIDVTGSNTYLNYTIRYIPKDSQYIDGPTGVTVKLDGNSYAVEVNPVSETGVKYALYGIDNTGAVSAAPLKGPQDGNTFGSLSADDLTKYTALKVVVTKDDTATTKYVFGDAVFSVVKLAAPSGFSVALDSSFSKNVLNWAVVTGATKYTWRNEGSVTGENESPQIIGVNDGEKYTIKAIGNLGNNGATSNGLVPVFYLDSDDSDTVEIDIPATNP